MSMLSRTTSTLTWPTVWTASVWKRMPRSPAQRADLPDGLEGADLIVGVHDGHQTGVGADGRRQLLQADQAVFMDGEVSDLEPLLLQLGQGVEHRVVLDGVGDDVALPGGRPPGGPPR